MVGERSIQRRRCTGRSIGAYRSENAGVSSERQVRILPVESLRVPQEGSSAGGKSGPKVRPKGVADGQQVDIPVLFIDRLTME